MNQNARQKAKTPVERDFYKLINNATFRIDCRNNIYNSKFEPIQDKIGKISFITKYTNILDNEKYRSFVSIETVRKEIEQTFNKKLLTLDPSDPAFEERKYLINFERVENLDTLESINKCKKKNQLKAKVF